MKHLKRVISSLIMACLLLALLPVSALAAHDSTGRPTDLTGQVYLSLYNGTGFPGEPAEHDSADYITFNSDFTVGDGNSVFADSASIVLQNKILEDVVEGTRTSDWLWTNYVWGVYDAEGSEEYLLADSALTTVANEQKLIRQVKGLAENADVSAYEIIWYVIKYQTSDSAWHIDGIVKEKDKFYVNFYGNGSTGGTAPVGSTELMEGEKYTVPGNTGTLQKQIGNNTYVFQGWNTMPDGTGTHYDQNDVITVSKDIALYAEWYLPGTYTATVVTHLDDEPANIGTIHGEEVSLSISADGVNFIQLSKTQTGTYTVTVTENGTYNIYHSHDGEHHQIENYELTVYNKNARVEIHHYSVSYDTQGGTWQENEDPGIQSHFLGTVVYATTAIPYRDDATFQHWVDQYGNEYAPDAAITLGIDKPYQLRAVWSDSINIKVNVTINHGTADGYDNNAATMFDAFYQLLMRSGDVNLPIGDRVQLTPDSHEGYDFIYDEANRVSTYTMRDGVYAYTDMPQGQYSIHTAKSQYTHTVTVEEEFAANGDLIINIIYNFEPNVFDLNFDIVVDDSVPLELYPQAVNVKILAWYRLEEGGELGWYVISQQQGTEPPISIPIDPATGRGTGFYPVWQYWANTADANPYFYRVQVSSFVLPDGTIAPATTTDLINYSIEGGFFNGQVDVVGGQVPTFPMDSDTYLPGVFYNPENPNGQHGAITISTTAKPYSITFNAMGGTINGESILVFENQYRHLDHARFIPVREGGYVFEGWYLDEACTIPAHDDHFGELLTSDVVHYAKWKAPRQISGTVYVDGTYGDDAVHESDRVQETIVLLEKLESGVYNQIGSYPITFTNIMQDVYSGTYIFENIPLDGSEYRITVIELNYRTVYGNNGDDNFNDTENVAIFVGNAATVDAYLSFEPESYVQEVIVDSSAIAEGFRPSNVEIAILYRDLGDIYPYATITQHIGGGVVITLTPNGTTYAGFGSETIWIYHTDGALYEYQVSISKVDGSDYQAATAPFYVIYDSPSYYNQDKNGQNAPLKATLVPKSFNVTFDLGLNIGEYVTGMNNYTNGDGTYSTTHTWGVEKKIDATPVRPGYYFKGWKCVTAGVDFFNDTIPATAAEDIVLEAQWERVTGFSYTVHYLDIDTGAVLHPAIITDGMKEGDVVYAANEILGIVGYDFHSASANSITISSDSALNVIVLYYTVETGASGGGMTNPVDDHLHLKKTAVLNDDGTYTIRLEVYATNNPISTYVRQDTPLDIVLVLDQSGSMYNDHYMDDLQTAADEFISMVASHGRGFEIDHRIAVVGFASNKSDGPSGDNPIAGGSNKEWVNTGFFDSNGQFHNYGTVGFTYTALGDKVPDTTGTYYVLVAGEAGTSTAVYNNLLYHDEYYHLLSADEAEVRYNAGERVYGYVNGAYLTLTLVGSEWTCNGELYSGNDYYSYYRDVWTHRDETDHRHIHAFGTDSNYQVNTGHENDKVYTRTASTNVGDESIYVDALMPVSTGKNGTGPINPGLLAAINNIGGSGATRTQYGIEMANDIFEANPYDSEKESRVRVVVVFTDGQPGYSGFEENEANAAIEQSYVSKNTYGAKVYTIGLYDSNGTNSMDNVSMFMNALSSNYPDAKNMNSIVSAEGYVALEDGTVLDKNKSYYVKYNYRYYELKYGTVRIGGWLGERKTCWYYSRSSTNYSVSETQAPVVTNGKVGTLEVFQYVSAAYKETPNKGFYQTSGNVEELYVLFDNIVVDITTKTSTEIVLHADGIIRDVMGQGLVLTEGTVITATSIPGMYIGEDNIVWNEGGSHTFATLALRNGWKTDQVTIDIPQKDGSAVSKNIYQIAVYNTHPDNTYTPNGPHTVDVSGYDFSTAFISSEHINGYKLVVEITRVEATDDVVWAHTMSTNNSKSGVWAPADEEGYRELLASFDQPSTIFAHRQYVLDYSKPFTLDGWYYTVGTNAGAVHIDTDVSNGMNWFDPADPTITSGLKTKYGVVKIVDGKVVYTPTTMNWTGYDSFYIFGDTGHAAIVSQDANSNGNLWTKVDIIPANNVYFEDSFVSGYDDTIDAERFGIAFSGNWNVDYAGALPGTNEGSADAVHGWTTDMSDDLMYSDGMAHIASTPGATATFTFTGTGVDIYSRCDIKTGIIVAQLKKQTIGVDGKETFVFAKTMIVDGLAMSGTYYQIPTLTFCGLEYGTYQVMIVVSSATANATGEARFNYYLDGVRVYTPIIDPNTTINDAYGRGEMNAVFTSVRDILLTNQDFNPDMSDSTDGKAGAVFVDWIRDGQGEEGDESGAGKPTYHIGTYAELGPKNEVYLAPGQTVVLKVDPANTYYVGMKCLAGYSVKAGFSGTDGANPVVHTVDHASDLYYKVVPVDGYIVITNTSAADSGEILSLTKLRATNGTGKPVDGGVQYVSAAEALEVTVAFMEALYAVPEMPVLPPEETEQDLAHRAVTEAMFENVRIWLSMEA